MRTPCGLSIRKLACPKNPIATALSSAVATRHSRTPSPATTSLHAACAGPARKKASKKTKKPFSAEGAEAPQRTRSIRAAIPAKAGIHPAEAVSPEGWIPAVAGMRVNKFPLRPPRILRVLCAEALFLQHHLDEKRPRRGDALGETAVEPVHVGDPRARHAEALRQPHPVDVGTPQIEHVERLPTRVAGPDIGQFALQDLVGAVRK